VLEAIAAAHEGVRPSREAGGDRFSTRWAPTRPSRRPLAPHGWARIPIPAEFQFPRHRHRLRQGRRHRGGASFSNYPFLLNNAIRSELFLQGRKIPAGGASPPSWRSSSPRRTCSRRRTARSTMSRPFISSRSLAKVQSVRRAYPAGGPVCRTPRASTPASGQGIRPTRLFAHR